MSIPKYIPLLALFLCVPAQAQQEIIEKMNELNTFFNEIKDPTVLTCLPPENATCTLEPLCKQAAANSDKSYLFKTPTGSIPNFILKEAITNNITECLNNRRKFSLGSVEWEVSESIGKSDAETQLAYRNFMYAEYNSLYNQTPSPFFESISHKAGRTEIETELKKRLPGVKDSEVIKKLSDVLTLKEKAKHQLSWQTLLNEKIIPVDQKAVMTTVSNVRDTMKKWIVGRGKKHAGAGSSETLDKLNIVIETEVKSESNCSLNDVAFYEPDTNKMVICPRGSTLPAGGLFTVVAHELGHAISPCNPSITQTAETKSSWDKVNQCLIDPKTGPGPKVASWNDIQTLVQNISDPAKKNEGQDLIRYVQKKYPLPYSCIQNGIGPHLQRLGVEPPQDQTEETQADWISSELIQLHSQNLKAADAKMFAMETLSPSILKRGCDLSNNKLVPKIEEAMKLAGCTETLTAKSSMLKDEGGDEHMDPERRFSVFLSTPAINQALGCESPGKGCR